MVFSVVLWMPSWGGMINGLMTLQGAWDKLRTDPILRMLVVAVGFYAMATFEGPMMSIRSVNSLSHYTEWTIGHVHSGALGWNGMITFGALYYLVPRLWKRERLYSIALVSWHFWLATIGIVLYTVSMWAAGLTEGLQWRAFDEAGQLKYPNFVDIVHQLAPFYWLRLLGGLLYLTGALMMAWNFFRTVSGSARAQAPAAAVPAH
jgi:cytochrome c oxidase cbb3-type subunit 1